MITITIIIIVLTAKWHLHLTNNGSMLLRVDYEAAVKLEMTYIGEVL